MADTASVVAAVVVLAGVVGATPLAASAGPGDAQVTTGTNGSTELAPGERLAGVVGVERAAVEGEVASRTFGQRVAAAESSASRAAVVGTEFERLQDRLADLRAQRAQLDRAYENGSLSRGQYRARLAQLHARERAFQRLANRTASVARDLPADRLRENGVNVSAIRTLRSEAANLTGPETAAIARSIAGPSAGRGLGAGGPPAFVADRTGGPVEPGGPPGDDDRTGRPTDAGNRTASDGADGSRAPTDAGNGTDDGGRDGSGRDGTDAGKRGGGAGSR